MGTCEDVPKKERTRGGGKMGRTRAGDGEYGAITDDDLRREIRGKGRVCIPGPEPICEDAPLSKTHSPPWFVVPPAAGAACMDIWLRAAIKAD